MKKQCAVKHERPLTFSPRNRCHTPEINCPASENRTYPKLKRPALCCAVALSPASVCPFFHFAQFKLSSNNENNHRQQVRIKQQNNNGRKVFCMNSVQDEIDSSGHQICYQEVKQCPSIYSLEQTRLQQCKGFFT